MASDEQHADDVKVTLEDVAASFARNASYWWCTATPQHTVLGLSIVLEALAYRFVQEHPEHRAAVLAHLQRGLDNVAHATGPRH